ncbi:MULTISPECIES: hypothetical protein [Pectobacterium]|nr:MULTISPECIES: hypothetical protein [Pectobacterium]MBA5237260.1 hypothetical protein [Pectobacterium aroidearum]QPI43354.1 hypothetical protein I2D83_01530 [Pectobacterium aroidearum]UUE36708.1 hypothetical protein L0Y26_01725 [Pectobacterium aroidearum]UUE41085.1 hypothetical protein L0Y25_01725 [Pectobacterium aroidearum]
MSIKREDSHAIRLSIFMRKVSVWFGVAESEVAKGDTDSLVSVALLRRRV